MTHSEIIEFKKFMTDRHVYIIFATLYRNHRLTINPVVLDSYLERARPENVIPQAFVYPTNLYGKDFWLEIHDEWMRELERTRQTQQNEKCMEGLDLEIISFEEECRLGVSGCVPLINRNIRYTVVFDIGGGSTEVSWARINQDNQVSIEGFLSFPLGVITVSEAFTGKDLSAAAYRAVVKKVLSYLRPFEEKYEILSKIGQGDVQMIAMSGTVTTIGAFHLGLPVYNRAAVDGMALSYDDLIKAKKKLERMTYEEKETHPCIGMQRADLSLPGCAILQGICEMWPIGEITIADRGLREGIVLDLIRRKNAETGKK